MFLKLLAGRVGQLINLHALSSDVGVSSVTLGEWLSVLEQSFIIFKHIDWFTSLFSEPIPSWIIHPTDFLRKGITNPSHCARDIFGE